MTTRGNNKEKRRSGTEYVPPEDFAVGHLARTVCRQLADQLDPALGARDVVDGLTTFFKLSGRIQAKAKNRQSVDTESEEG
ncbi:MAG: hypothetical protein AAF125_07380 [Chloroflexota bacterium]